MSVIFLLIPLSIVTAGVFLGGFIWAVRSGQYEDTCTPGMRPLLEEQPVATGEAGGEPAKNCTANDKRCVAGAARIGDFPPNESA